jgi:hypothetical protein
VLDRMKIEPAEALMVGDWPERDIVGAAVVGIKTVFARYGDTFGTKESGADYEIKDVYNLVGIVDELNKVGESGRDAGRDATCGMGRDAGHAAGRARKPSRKGPRKCTS